MKLRIEVTETDIARGEENSACRCPVALALVRQIPGFEPEVGIMHLDMGWLFKTPESVCEFIYNFDEGEFVEPFAFDIDIDAPVSP